MHLTLHQHRSLHEGPRVLMLGAVHGNETCGAVALQRLHAALTQGQHTLLCGSLTLLPVTNPLAHAKGQRMGDRNLNRQLVRHEAPVAFEDHLANQLLPLLAAHDVLLDLHSFHTPGQPFALIGPRNNQGDLEPFAQAEAEEALALRLGISRFVEGWLDTYAAGVRERQARGVAAHVDYGVGTTEAMRRLGGMAITLECGQHDEASAPERAYQAACAALVHLGLLEGIPPGPCATPEVIRLVQVHDRLHPDDRFAKPWRSFEALHQGDLIGHRRDGTEVRSDRDGWIVFPNPQAGVDQEWFYIAEASDRL
jgi:predicted deacylase